MNHATAVSEVSDLTSSIANQAGIMIAAAVATGKRLPITTLSKDVGKQLDADHTFCYQVISRYMKIRGDLVIKMGPNGGIELRPPQTSDVNAEVSE